MIAEVQCLEKITDGRIRKELDKGKQREGKIVVILRGGKILTQGTASKLSVEAGYTRETTRTCAWRNHTDRKGHEYKHSEEEK